MENASKALLIAGSVLIALMILGALVLMFGNLTNYQRTQDEANVTKEIAEFNNQFMPYEKDELTLMEMYTLYNKIKSVERRTGFKIDNNIADVYEYHTSDPEKFGGDKDLSQYDINTAFNKSQNPNDYVPDSSKSNRKFKCDSVEYDNEGRINYMKFSEITDYDNLRAF